MTPDRANVLAVDRALEHLARLDPRLAEVVECRFFAGYSATGTAVALRISERSVHRDWATAKAWLAKEIVS